MCREPLTCAQLGREKIKTNADALRITFAVFIFLLLLTLQSVSFGVLTTFRFEVLCGFDRFRGTRLADRRRAAETSLPRNQRRSVPPDLGLRRRTCKAVAIEPIAIPTAPPMIAAAATSPSLWYAPPW